MSYQNPLTLTPKLYQSTDKDAPQLTGVAGEIKTIFKACLVTGYGSKTGAGFEIDNESTTSAEFVSPNIMMSKIGINDASGVCIPYYYYGTSKQEATYNGGRIERSAVKGGSWTMLVCELGLYFVSTTSAGLSQVLYMGLIKSAINDNNQNMTLQAFGLINSASRITQGQGLAHIGAYNSFNVLSSNFDLINGSGGQDKGLITLSSEVFLRNGNTLLGSVPAVLMVFNGSSVREVAQTTHQNRPVLSVFVANGRSDSAIASYAYGVLIYLDEWSY